METNRWTVVIRTIPVIAKENEYLDYDREQKKTHEHLSLKEVIGFVNHFADRYPDADFYSDNGLSGTGMTYNEGPEGVYHDLEILKEDS